MSILKNKKLEHNSIYHCSILQLPKIHNRAGNITALQNLYHIPFETKRVYYLYDVPGGESRGGHAHKELHQILVAAGGSYDVTIDDGINKRTLTLNRPYFGLYIVPGIWRELSNFSSGAICLVLASHLYDANDYVRNYEEFKSLKQ
jgi:hypothetical protein